MALEAVVSSEGLFGCGAMAASAGGGWSLGHGGHGGVDVEMDLEESSATATCDVGAYSSMLVAAQGVDEPAGSSAVPTLGGNASAAGAKFTQEMSPAPLPAAGRRKRPRSRSVKNREEAESQRMTHIAVERNRRRQMSEYLAVLRSVMPPSYVQRGDQASIIGGAINYVKELEQLVQSLEARKHARNSLSSSSPGAAAAMTPCFAASFTFPQYLMSAVATNAAPPVNVVGGSNANGGDDDDDTAALGSRPSSVANVEVTMVESHANLKVLSRRRPRQLLRVVTGLQGHRLTVLHLNVASAGPMALYSLSLKVEDDCRLSSVDDIASAVHRIIEAIELEEKGQPLLDGAAEPGPSETTKRNNSSRV